MSDLFLCFLSHFTLFVELRIVLLHFRLCPLIVCGCGCAIVLGGYVEYSWVSIRVNFTVFLECTIFYVEDDVLGGALIRFGEGDVVDKVMIDAVCRCDYEMIAAV